MNRNLKLNQADGPFRPSAFAVMSMLRNIPPHEVVESIAINGETGVVVVDTSNEQVERRHVFRNVSVEA